MENKTFTEEEIQKMKLQDLVKNYLEQQKEPNECYLLLRKRLTNIFNELVKNKQFLELDKYIQDFFYITLLSDPKIISPEE